MFSTNPPPEITTAPIIQHITDLYKNIYRLGHSLPKRDKLGLHTKLENQCGDCLKLAIEAAFTPRWQKTPYLQKLRLEIEVAKRLARMEHELKIIDSKNYLNLAQQLCDISKETTGWINSLQKKETA